MATAARRWSASVPLLAAGLLIGAAVAWFALHGRQPAVATHDAPTYTRLTFERGTIRDARFTPDGQTVLIGSRTNKIYRFDVVSGRELPALVADETGDVELAVSAV